MGFLILIVAHYLAGNGLLHLFGLKLKSSRRIPLAIITGVALLSLVPFALELMKIPITLVSVAGGICMLVFLLNASLLWKLRSQPWKRPQLNILPSFRIYEWPFMLLFCLFLIGSVWRAFYLPPTARDMLSGPEVIAEYAVKEHSMINSVLTINLETTNNHLKPPFITCLQIIYKLFGIQFGQLWLSLLFVSFVVVLYGLLKERLHPVLACALLTLFFSIPELYGYSYVILFDYSNMIFFFLGFYFLYSYFDSAESKQFYFSTLLFAFATFIRSETLILVAMVMPAYWLFAFRSKQAIGRVVLQSAVLILASFFAYYIWIGVFLKYYMPVKFAVGSQINHDLLNFRPLFTRFADMTTKIMFGAPGRSVWGFYFHIFAVISIAELLVMRKISKEGRRWWYAILVVYIGLPVIGYLIPIADLINTTKRGLFKLLPFMLMAMANNGFLRKLSDAIIVWEEKSVTERPQPAPVKQQPVKRPSKKN